MTNVNTTPALPMGRERTCAQCGTLYRSPRANSRYCSNACRCKAKRGKSPKLTAPIGTAGFSIIGKLLLRLNMAGPIGPATVYGLTVARIHALAELRLLFDRKGWGHLTDAEFDAAMSADGIRAYSTDSPKAIERKRLQARQRVAAARLREAA